MFAEKLTNILIQFQFEDKSDNFKLGALEFNEIPQNLLMASALFEKMGAPATNIFEFYSVI